MVEGYMPDDILLKRIAQGDEDAFKIIFERYRNRFYGAALKMTKSSDLAEEIVQEVFLTLWLHRSSLGAVKNPLSYLFTIVYNTIYRQFKKKAREQKVWEVMGDEAMGSECETEMILAEKEQRKLLQNIILQLPTQQQVIFRLSKQEGLNRDEIAAQLHLSPNTVRNHLLKAMEYVRNHFPRELLLLICWLFS